jgi:hypothetical protein
MRGLAFPADSFEAADAIQVTARDGPSGLYLSIGGWLMLAACMPPVKGVCTLCAASAVPAHDPSDTVGGASVRVVEWAGTAGRLPE